MYSPDVFGRAASRANRPSDEAAVLACSIYVDLNPIRARVAETPESSEYTAAFERVAARQATTAYAIASGEPYRVAGRDTWLSPVPGCRCGASAPRRWNAVAIGASVEPRIPAALARRLFGVVGWTGRQVRLDKPGTIPAADRASTGFKRLHLADFAFD